MKLNTSKILAFLAYTIAIAFSVKSLREPDLWWQIRTGEWILANGHVPTTDVFSMTKYGTDWINIKWGFEVLAALITKHLGAESVFLLQIIVSVLILYFLRKTALLFGKINDVTHFLSSIFIFMAIQYRVIGRPEMFSHLFLVLFIYLLLLHQKTASRLLWLLIPLQIIWANMHEAYGMGIVIVGIYMVGQWGWAIVKKIPKPRPLLYVFLGLLAAVCINPRGWLLIWHPLNIFSQVQNNNYTTELGGVLSAKYWQLEAFILSGLVVCLGIYLFFALKNKKINSLTDRFTVGYFLLLLAFLFLGLTAYRNAVFFFLTAFPLITFGLDSLKLGYQNYTKTAILFGVLFYCGIVSNIYYQITASRDRFGLEVLGTHNPVGAANYIQNRGLKTKKGFSDYLTSSYLLWKLQPAFKTYIDLRDLDVFSNQDFDSYLKTVNSPEQFMELDKRAHFDYVVLYRLSDPYLHAYLYIDSIYACTYVDAVAAVYEKTDDFTREDIFSNCPKVESSVFAWMTNHLLNPFYQPFDYAALDYDYYAAEFYLTVGRLILAENRIEKFLRFHPAHTSGIDLKKRIDRAKTATTQSVGL